MARAVRPPRPQELDPDLVLKVAQIMGMKPREIVALGETPTGETLVTTQDGNISVIGENGKPQAYRPVPENRAVGDEPWTLKDLDREADRVLVVLGGDPLVWVEQNPIRAWALWRHVAAARGISMTNAAVEDKRCAECRRIILHSEWLTSEDAQQL